MEGVPDESATVLYTQNFIHLKDQMEAPSEIRAAAEGQIESDGTKSSPCLVASKIPRLYKISYHIESLNACMKY